MSDPVRPGISGKESVVADSEHEERSHGGQPTSAAAPPGLPQPNEGEDQVDGGERPVERAPGDDLHVAPAGVEHARAGGQLSELEGAEGDVLPGYVGEE